MYYLSITDIIWHSLNNPTLFDQMYFGPGKMVKRNLELWHGNLWKESPRFGCAFTQINGSMCNFLRNYYQQMIFITKQWCNYVIIQKQYLFYLLFNFRDIQLWRFCNLQKRNDVKVW